MTVDEERNAWLDWRRGGIGASDIGAVVEADGAFGTPYSVWLSKVHGVDGDESGRGDQGEEECEFEFHGLLDWGCTDKTPRRSESCNVRK